MSTFPLFPSSILPIFLAFLTSALHAPMSLQASLVAAIRGSQFRRSSLNTFPCARAKSGARSIAKKSRGTCAKKSAMRPLVKRFRKTELFRKRYSLSVQVPPQDANPEQGISGQRPRFQRQLLPSNGVQTWGKPITCRCEFRLNTSRPKRFVVGGKLF